MTVVEKGSSKTTAYSYDSNNRLLEETSNLPWGASKEYKYDPAYKGANMKVDLRKVMKSAGFFDKSTGEFVTEIRNDADSSRYLELPNYSLKEVDFEFFNSLENPHLGKAFLSHYGEADDEFFFDEFLESDFDLSYVYTEFIDKKELGIAQRWAEENGIDYFISDDPM